MSEPENPAPPLADALPQPAAPAQPEAKLPAVVPPPRAPASPPRRRVSRILVPLCLLVVAGLGGGYWWLHPQSALPPGIVAGNGRLAADEIDIATKFAGRVLQLLVDEGDVVRPGQIVAVMDTRDLQAQLKQHQQLLRQAERALEQARARYAQQQAVVNFARQEVNRTAYLVPRGSATREKLEQQKQALDSATAELAADAAAIGAAEHAAAAAAHQVEFYQVNITDNSLVAPKEGPIEYRVASVGEVLPAGGRVLTMLDASYVYMDIYLPTAAAGRVRIGSDARIVLDAYPGHVIPAKVVFVAAQAQFTPKTVETKDERDKLMFRVRVRIDPERLQGRAALVKEGLPGVAYVATAPGVGWPALLQPPPPPPPPAPVPR